MTTKGKINWFAFVLHLSANSFVVFVFKFCHLRVMLGLLTWERKKNTVKQMKPPTETYTTAFFHVSGRLLDLNVRSSHLNLIKWIIKRTKSFLSHMNRIAKLPTFGNSLSTSYQTQFSQKLNSIITGGIKSEIGINFWSKCVKYLVKNTFQETSLTYPVSQHLGC